MILRSHALSISLAVALALGLGFVMASGDYNISGAILVGLGLAFVSVFLLSYLAKGEKAQWFLTILGIGLAVKLAAALFRMNLSILEYGGLYDAGRYHSAGVRIAEDLWRFDFASATAQVQLGTFFTEFYAGIVHAVIGPTVSGAYMVFGLLAFVGSYFCYKAFCIAFPHGNRLFYAMLAFLYPSVVYWPNGIGKDALMALFIGLTAYGGALLMKGRFISSLIPLGLGLVGSMTVRPHVAGMLGIALLIAFVLGKTKPGGGGALVWRVALVMGGVLLLAQFMPTILDRSGIDDLSLDPSEFDAMANYYERRQNSTSRGGSAFDAPSFSDPLFVPKAVFTFLFRPMVWEAHNLLAGIQAIDSVLLVGLLLWRSPYVFNALIGFRENPYLAFLLVFILLLSVALMTSANFGIIARQRAMVLPLVFMLIAYQPPPRKKAQPREQPQSSSTLPPRSECI
jgi:hypothetical protein